MSDSSTTSKAEGCPVNHDVNNSGSPVNHGVTESGCPASAELDPSNMVTHTRTRTLT